MNITHPWPTVAGDARRTSIACVRGAVEGVDPATVKKTSMDDLDPVDMEIGRLAAAASARIENYATGSPLSIKDEVIVRMVGWWRDLKSPLSLAADTVSPDPLAFGSPFRRSGAMSLLSPWRSRGAGVVGDV